MRFFWLFVFLVYSETVQAQSGGQGVTVNLDVLGAPPSPAAAPVPVAAPAAIAPVPYRPPVIVNLDVLGLPAAKTALQMPNEKKPPVKKPILPSASLTPVEPPQETHPANTDIDGYRLVFDAQSETVPASEQDLLDALAQRLQKDAKLKVQMRSFAGGTPDMLGQSRRLSLRRALKIRNYLLQKNIAPTRLDVRALGNAALEMGEMAQASKIPPDRIDIFFIR